MLLDILKECAQAASLGLQWGQMTSPQSVTAAFITPPLNTAADPSLGKLWHDKNILSKAFRGVDDLLKSCQDESSSELVWSKFRDSSLLELPLRNYSLTAPAAASEQEGGTAPSINTELCSAIYAYTSNPCWSPLLSRSILPHVQHILKWSTVEKCLENLDVTSAVVNLVQFVAMRLSSGLVINSDSAPSLRSTTGPPNTVLSYLEQIKDSDNASETALVSSVQDLVQLLKGLKLVRELIEGHILVSMTEKVKGRNNLHLTKVQLLCSNINHSIELLKTVCSSLCWLIT